MARQLTRDEIDYLATKPNARRVAVESFLGYFPLDIGEAANLQNLQADSHVFHWNSQTQNAIKVGLVWAFHQPNPMVLPAAHTIRVKEGTNAPTVMACVLGVLKVANSPKYKECVRAMDFALAWWREENIRRDAVIQIARRFGVVVKVL